MTEKQQAYRVYLASQHWQRIRLAAMDRDKHKCVDCGVSEGLQVHHWQYRESPYQTKLQDVYTVCQACHEKAHDIKRDESGRVVSLAQMPSYLKPKLADRRKPKGAPSNRELKRGRPNHTKRHQIRLQAF